MQGKLTYVGKYYHGWAVVEEDGTTTRLEPIITNILLQLAGKRTSHQGSLNSYSFTADDESEFKLKYKEGYNPILVTVDKFGFSNLGYYIMEALSRFGGRQVLIAHGGTYFTITPDPNEEVMLVKFHKENYCRIPKDKLNEVCKPGTEDCCIFIVCGADSFDCAKFSGSTSRLLLDRYASDNIRASRIGNCALAGREDS